MLPRRALSGLTFVQCFARVGFGFTVPSVNTPQNQPDEPSPRPPNGFGSGFGGVLGRVVAVGDELLSGDTVNTNASFVGTRCRELGITLDRVVTVRDRIEEIVDAVRRAAATSDVCFVTGGLGPTTDDLTTEAVAAAAEDTVVRDPESLARLEAKFAAFGYRDMPPSNRKQADFPSTATILANPIGSAEGFMVFVGGCPVFVLPGVPREMKQMFRDQVTPHLRRRFELRVTPRRMYRLLGRGESSLAKDLEPIVDRARARSAGLASVFVHYRASTPEVLVVLEATAGAEGVSATEAELSSLDTELLEVMGSAIYGIGDAELAPRVVAALQAAGLRLSVAESCTGGGLGKRLVGTPGASSVFDGGIVSYSNAVKTGLLGVEPALLAEHGAVSEPVARAMAQGARKATGSDLSVAITGIAGPGGGTPLKPVGTVHIDVFDGDVHLHKQLKLRGNRGTVQHCAELWALKLVWDRLHARGLAPIAQIDRDDA